MLNELKLLLGITDDAQDGKLNLLIETATSRLKLLLGGIDPPDSMDYIIREVAIVRFNRIGSEGLASHTVEGESLSFAGSDFAPYAGEIRAFLDSQEESKRGRVRFL